MRASGSNGPVPVIVELFTSEGCSSCPPADRLLNALADEQPVPGAIIVPLELHVDYWDDLGWTDPFSSAAFSERQRSYRAMRGGGSSFTPEAVVAGRDSMLGSRRDALIASIEAARDAPRVTVDVKLQGEDARVSISSEPPRAATLFVAVAEHGLVTRVERGENAGRTLAHAPVVRALQRVGPARVGEHSARLPSVAGVTGDTSVVAFVQEDESRAIRGAAVERAP